MPHMQGPVPPPERLPVQPVDSNTEVSMDSESPLIEEERAYQEEQIEEAKEAFLESEVFSSSTSRSTGQAGISPTSVPKDEVMIRLEQILEEGLGDYVAAMPEEARVRFLYKGQETAGQISIMVRAFKVKAKKVVALIHDWLLTIPGVNKFFLEQEAKIKTDRILDFEREYRDQGLEQK